MNPDGTLNIGIAVDTDTLAKWQEVLDAAKYPYTVHDLADKSTKLIRVAAPVERMPMLTKLINDTAATINRRED